MVYQASRMKKSLGSLFRNHRIPKAQEHGALSSIAEQHDERGQDQPSAMANFFINSHNLESNSVQEDAAPFKHAPLDGTRDEIRLACFHTVHDGSKMFFEIKKVDLHVDLTQHEALSYTWGPAMPEKSIIDFESGRTLSIRQNLHDYLSIWCRGIVSPWIWIDQVCVDQSSVNERNHQVQLMERIFSSASVVVVWLGSHPRGYHFDHEDDEIISVNGEVVRASLTYPHNTYRVNDVQYLASGTDTDFTMLFSMNVYWTRLWILQEVILARKLSFRLNQCRIDSFSTNMIPFDEVPPVLQWIMDVRYHNSHRTTMLQSVTSIYNCFENTSDNKCEDPRDKLFGLQSLLAKEDRIVIDYGKSARQVFLEGAVMLMLHTSHTSYKDISRCMYFFGRGMGVIDNNFGWVDLATRLDRAHLPVDQSSHAHIDQYHSKFPELVGKLWLAIDDMLVD